MSLFSNTTPRQLAIGLTILRLVVGVTFVMHGAQKLFVFGLDGVSNGFAQMGMPMPGVVGPLVALLEFFGGFALILGLLTRLTSLGLAITMVGAMLLVHLENGFFMPNGIELVLSLLGGTAALTLMGAGPLSLDTILVGRRQAAVVEPARTTSRQAA